MAQPSYKKFVRKNCINISEMHVVSPDHNFQAYVTSSPPFDSENQASDSLMGSLWHKFARKRSIYIPEQPLSILKRKRPNILKR
jgi:hypothetical protein